MKKVALLCGINGLLAVQAFAAPILSDVLTVFNAAGALVGQVGVYEDGTMFGLNAAVVHLGSSIPNGEDPSGVYYINDSTLADPTKLGQPINLRESVAGPFSDVFGVVVLSGSYYLGFTSDTENVPPAFAPVGTTIILENQASYDATAFLNPALQRAGYTATFTSDPSEVPEPTTFGLMTGGLLGLGGVVRKRRHA